jgi:ABC-type branched-subunit amino acid transport system substrate-binding protein
MMSIRWTFAALAFVLIAAPAPSFAQQPIRIGATTALTGEASIQGGYVREGYLLCQKHANEKGGVLGRQIEFVMYDDQSNGKTAAGLYEKLIAEDKVDTVLGPYWDHRSSSGCKRKASDAHDSAHGGDHVDLGEGTPLSRYGSFARRRLG